jgi:lactate permease
MRTQKNPPKKSPNLDNALPEGRRKGAVYTLVTGFSVQVAAKSIGVPQTSLLALQAIGGTAGNMICINNIIQARTVVGGRAMHVSEGSFIRKTAPALAAMLVIGTLVSLLFLFA